MFPPEQDRAVRPSPPSDPRMTVGPKGWRPGTETNPSGTVSAVRTDPSTEAALRDGDLRTEQWPRVPRHGLLAEDAG